MLLFFDSFSLSSCARYGMFYRDIIRTEEDEEMIRYQRFDSTVSNGSNVVISGVAFFDSDSNSEDFRFFLNEAISTVYPVLILCVINK